MRKIGLSPDELVHGLLGLSQTERVCILDSCGVGHVGSHLMIAGVVPVESVELSERSVEETLRLWEGSIRSKYAAIFTLSYDFGIRLQKLSTQFKKSSEPDVFISLFDALVVHDYTSGETYVVGNERRFNEIETRLNKATFNPNETDRGFNLRSNFTIADYITAVEKIQELIRNGDTYQTNLTRQISVNLPPELTVESIFWRLRKKHPAPFSALLKRPNSSVISASPERFFRIDDGRITSSPIKGTRPRGVTAESDLNLRQELAHSEKDRAENTMIVDLLRNDLGRVCDYGSVIVEKLCDIEEHPSLFHLVSTISGDLRRDTRFANILTALFPCGSITGAPKISTMKIIDEIERTPRGLSMGAIGLRLPASFGLGDVIDTSVAIRTMVIENGEATFNVGGGIVIDSEPEAEFAETVVKSKALLETLGVNPSELSATSGV